MRHSVGKIILDGQHASLFASDGEQVSTRGMTGFPYANSHGKDSEKYNASVSVGECMRNTTSRCGFISDPRGLDRSTAACAV